LFFIKPATSDELAISTKKTNPILRALLAKMQSLDFELHGRVHLQFVITIRETLPSSVSFFLQIPLEKSLKAISLNDSLKVGLTLFATNLAKMGAENLLNFIAKNADGSFKLTSPIDKLLYLVKRELKKKDKALDKTLLQKLRFTFDNAGLGKNPTTSLYNT
jgi:hypothetical protein